MIDWFDAALAPVSHRDRGRLLSELGVVLAQVPPDVVSWGPLRDEAARRSVSALLSGDDAGAGFWARTAQEFGDRQDLTSLTHPRLRL